MQPFNIKIKLEGGNMFMNKLLELQKKIGYSFQDIDLLKIALTHTSYANEHKKKMIKHNERLEFLGDSVLSLIITTYLFKNLSNIPEGELSRIRSTIVCENSLKMSGDKFGLSQYIYMGKGEEQTGGRNRSSIVSDAFEALIASIYLDSGYESAEKFVLSQMDDIIQKAIQGKLFKDYKTQYQEVIQKKSNAKIEYVVISEEGPDHQKTFTVSLLLNDNVISTGKGRSKKVAEQKAAEIALEKMNG